MPTKKPPAVKKPIPVAPVNPVAKNPLLRNSEEAQRQLYYIQKTFLGGTPEDVLNAVRSVTPTDSDPSNASCGAFASISTMDSWISHSESLRGRKPGALAPETVFLMALIKKFPRDRTTDLWSTLRVIVDNVDNPRNPTPGSCPFTATREGATLIVLKGGKPYVRKAFNNAISQIKTGKVKQRFP